MTTRYYSRRSLVTTAAAAALTPAVPLAAEAALGVAPNADIELLQLGVRLLAINRRIDKLEASPTTTDEDIEKAIRDRADVVPKILARTATTIDGLAKIYGTATNTMRHSTPRDRSSKPSRAIRA